MSDEDGTVNLKDMSQEECRAFMGSIGEPAYRGDQVLEWVHRSCVLSYDGMSNLPKSLRAKLSVIAPIARPRVVARQVSSDGDTSKLLLALADGNAVETVLMRHDYGLALCVSSQVGCAMGCSFCASGLSGLVRNLTCGEMVDQMIAASQEAVSRYGGDGRISSVVMMGSGEPLMNYDNVLKFIRLINWSRGFGVGMRHVTVSTCGIVPGIGRLAREGLPLTLSVSLHAPDDETRSSIMRINTVYPVAQVVQACKEYSEVTSRRVTYEYSMIAGVNDSQAHARLLASLLFGSLCHVNLIPLNPVPETGFRRSSPEDIRMFAATLIDSGIETTCRREMGSGIDAACGQLRRRMCRDGKWEGT